MLFFLFLFVHYHSNMHACMQYACFFLKERLVIHPSSHPFIHFSTYPPFYLIYLQDMRIMRLLLWYAENRLTDRHIFSSKITFLYDPCVFISEFLINSTILHENQYYLRHLHRFLASAPEVGEDSSWFLCYNATSHGWKNKAFHDRCDGKRNTVTIIQKGQYVFGGYTDIPWGKIYILILSTFKGL